MSAAPLEGAPETAPCPVHPYGYHERSRVRPVGSSTVFRHTSPIGFPARCARLESELDASDRERDFIDELWVRERASRGHGLALTGAGAVVAVIAALVVTSAAVPAVLVCAVAGGLAITALDRVDVAIQRERLRRIRDWHRRVGSPR